MPRVALIHDFLLDLRGAERVFAAICDAYPDADVFTAVYDEHGTEGRFAARSPQASFLQRLRPTARTFRPLLPFYPARDRVAGPARLRHRRLLARARGRTACSSIPAPCTSVTATTRSATRGPSARRRSPRATSLTRAAAARAAVALAPVGLDRRPARRRLRRQLGDHRGADPALLRARVDGPAPAGGALALLARAGRRALPGAGRADGAQAHRRRDPRLQRARAAARGRGGRAGVAAAAAPRRADRAADRPAVRRRGRRPAAHLAGAGRHRRGGVRDRGGRVAGVRAAR